MLRKAFATWKERHASWQQAHAKVARAAALWHNRALAGAWQQWKESAIYQQEVRQRLTGAIGVSFSSGTPANVMQEELNLQRLVQQARRQLYEQWSVQSSSTILADVNLR